MRLGRATYESNGFIIELGLAILVFARFIFRLFAQSLSKSFPPPNTVFPANRRVPSASVARSRDRNVGI